MKYGLLEYTTSNIGDEIQSLAAKQLLPKVDTYLKRDYLNQVNTQEEIKIILNGWFTHHPENWPPADNINPLIISFHIDKEISDRLLTPKSVEYLKRYDPIGCRDLYTKSILENNGIDAYFSGCLTLTLTPDQQLNNSDEILLVDLDHEVVDALPDNLTQDARTMSHYTDPIEKIENKTRKNVPATAKKIAGASRLDHLYNYLFDITKNRTTVLKTDRESKFQKAKQYLARYAQAELVITSRLHVTLPCLAFDTPVILVHRNINDPRFSGLSEYMNLVDRSNIINQEYTNFLDLETPKSIVPIQKELENAVEEFIAE
ncbi:polysaccharide pyruvyl transferase family protein [Halorarum salinum]|uniref:Polysaccharide pyruvyl transferase family protein n=1 Tax=Halorarum salinum TaxID=2743089 RepID=A0A7D5L8Y7_9EURY|nr:polysaccharide pyruvyl transferase family protein [Halobaculum salinum]QLG61086.1 polysaccharide pyruvyl transferase family protein [Halobaculum salinum]